MYRQKGFTLIEIVISIALVILITGVIMSGIGPWIKFKQRLETEQNLRDLVQATSALYKANAFSIDNTDNASPGSMISTAGGGTLQLAGLAGGPPGAVFAGNCDAGDPADTTAVLAALAPLQPYLAKPISDLARDGFNNKICFQVSKRLFREVNGTKLYYHSVAFVAPGDNTVIDPGTQFIEDTSGMVLTLGGDDTGQVVDGFKIALANYKITTERLQKMASAYETYFQIRFLTKIDRDISINYFYADDLTNNGDPGNLLAVDPGPTAPETKKDLGATWELASFSNVIEPLPLPDGALNRFVTVLGISDMEGRDAWGNPLLIDNRSSRVKPGVGVGGPLDGVKLQPPFSVSFGALLPGTNTDCTSGGPDNVADICPTYISAGAVGKY